MYRAGPALRTHSAHMAVMGPGPRSDEDGQISEEHPLDGIRRQDSYNENGLINLPTE